MLKRNRRPKKDKERNNQTHMCKHLNRLGTSSNSTHMKNKNKRRPIEKNTGRDDLLTISPAWVPIDTTIKHLAYDLRDDNPPPENYYPIFTSLVFNTEKPGDGHAVCGFLCDGQKAIFDSNGYFEFLDWEDINDLELYAEILGIIFKSDLDYHLTPHKSHIFYMKKGLNLNYSICN